MLPLFPLIVDGQVKWYKIYSTIVVGGEEQGGREVGMPKGVCLPALFLVPVLPFLSRAGRTSNSESLDAFRFCFKLM